MDNKKDGYCQMCDGPISGNVKTENKKQFCCMGCLKKYREAKANAK